MQKKLLGLQRNQIFNQGSFFEGGREVGWWAKLFGQQCVPLKKSWLAPVYPWSAVFVLLQKQNLFISATRQCTFFLILKGKGDIRFCTEHKQETNSLFQLLYISSKYHCTQVLHVIRQRNLKATHDYQKICNDSDQLVKLTFLFTALRHLGRLGRHFEIAIGSNSDLSTTERTKHKIKALVWQAIMEKQS